MRQVGPSSVEEYASWYLRRNRRKHPDVIADDGGDPVEVMQRCHPGKMRDWFGGGTRCSIVSLDTVTDLANLVFLECEWTKREGLVIPDGKDYRLLGRVAENAITGNYLARPTANKHRHYHDKFVAGALRLEGENRVAICSAEENEIRSNPGAQYYLLDGVGRCLPYMILILEHKREFEPIEAFCVVR